MARPYSPRWAFAARRSRVVPFCPPMSRSGDEAVQKGLEGGGRVRGEPAVDGAGLDDGAARCAEPAEPAAEAAERRKTPAGLAAAHPAHGVERGGDGAQVERGRERQQALLVQPPRGLEVVGRLAVDDDADVEELLALHLRDAAQDDVLVAGGGHAAPPGSQAPGLA